MTETIMDHLASSLEVAPFTLRGNNLYTVREEVPTRDAVDKILGECLK